MSKPRSSEDELGSLLNRQHGTYLSALNRLAVALVQGDLEARAKAMSALAELVGYSGILSDLIGRRRTLLTSDWVRAHRGKLAASPATPLIPNVPAARAIEDLISREPRLAKSAAEIAVTYSQHGFAAARSAELSLTKALQGFLERAMREGGTVPSGAKQIAFLGGGDEEGFTRSYAETVFRTNLATAYNAGLIEQAKDPDVKEVIPALEYSAVMDVDTRPNHAAANGMIATADDPIWNVMGPPAGHRCRCVRVLVDAWTLREKGLIDDSGNVTRYLPPTFSQAHPDPGFKVI